MLSIFCTSSITFLNETLSRLSPQKVLFTAVILNVMLPARMIQKVFDTSLSPYSWGDVLVRINRLIFPVIQHCL